MTRPYATVLIDTYNHERFIEQAITSVLEQDFPAADREILVVDDGSTDRTPDLVRRFEPHIRLLRKPNGGQASAFNAGIPESRGEVVAFLDGDDWWAPHKLSRVVAAMQREPALGIVGHGITEAFSDNRRNIVCLRQDERCEVHHPLGARTFRLRKCFLGTSRMTIRRAVLQKILPVPEALIFEADEFVFTLVAAQGDLLILAEPLTFYRLHGENLFLMPGGNKAGLRRKQQVQSILAATLREALPPLGMPAECIAIVTEVIAAEAEQMRLALEYGFPWETVSTELQIQRIMHGKVGFAQRCFKWTSLLPALVLPSRWYYAARAGVSRHSLYLSVRERWLPIPELENFSARPNTQP